MEKEMFATGRIIIELNANGFTVALPKRPGADMEQSTGRIMESLKETLINMQRDPDDPEFIRAAAEEKPFVPEYEMTPVGNVFVFKTFSQVLDFLKRKLNPKPEFD